CRPLPKQRPSGHAPTISHRMAIPIWQATLHHPPQSRQWNHTVRRLSRQRGRHCVVRPLCPSVWQL
ncbi:MAG: hypothetical protein ACKVJ3_07865, partial [bacterium]